MPRAITCASIAHANLVVGWVVYIFCFYPFVIQQIGHWLMFLLTVGGAYSAYRLSAGNHRTLKIQLFCSIALLLMHVLLWANRVIKSGHRENDWFTYVIEMEARLVSHFLSIGELARGVQQILWDIVPVWIAFSLVIYLGISKKNQKSKRNM